MTDQINYIFSFENLDFILLIILGSFMYFLFYFLLDQISKYGGYK